jgi:tetratricopeptide (TPR) repeat protein
MQKRARARSGSVHRVACSLILGVVGIILGVSALACGDALERALNLEKAGDLEGAIVIYEKVVADDPDNLEALSAEAVCLLQLLRYDEALSLQERVVALDPKDSQSRVELGFNYLNHQNRSADAVRVLSEACEIEPIGKNLAYLAQAKVAAGDVSGAESTLRNALEVDPAYGYAYAQLALLLEAENRSQEAERVRQLAIAHGIDLGVAE